MIAALAAWQTRDESDCAAPASPAAPPPQHANPLRSGETVKCPACGEEGLAWQWAGRRPPAYREWTVPTYRCKRRGCHFIFALREPATPVAPQ